MPQGLLEEEKYLEEELGEVRLAYIVNGQAVWTYREFHVTSCSVHMWSAGIDMDDPDAVKHLGGTCGCPKTDTSW